MRVVLDARDQPCLIQASRWADKSVAPLSQIYVNHDFMNYLNYVASVMTLKTPRNRDEICCFSATGLRAERQYNPPELSVPNAAFFGTFLVLPSEVFSVSVCSPMPVSFSP